MEDWIIWRVRMGRLLGETRKGSGYIYLSDNVVIVEVQVQW